MFELADTQQTTAGNSPQSDPEAAAARRKILNGELEVNPATYFESLVPENLAVKIRDRLNREIAKNPSMVKDAPELKGGIREGSTIVNNDFALAVGRYQSANGLLSRSPDGLRVASGSVDAATYRALFPEEFPLKAPTLPKNNTAPALGGFRRLGDTTFYRAGDIYLQSQSDGTVKFYRNFPNSERSDISTVNQIAVETQGEAVRAERIVTKTRNQRGAVAYSADGWGGIQNQTESTTFASGTVREQLVANGFSQDEKEKSVYRRQMVDSKGNSHTVVAIASDRSIQALLLPLDTPASAKPSEISRPQTRSNQKYPSLRETVVRIKTNDTQFEVVSLQGRASVVERNDP